MTTNMNMVLYFEKYNEVLEQEEFAKLEMAADAVISNLLNDGAPVLLTTLGYGYDYERIFFLERKMNNKSGVDLLDLIYFHLHNFIYNYTVCVLWNDTGISERIKDSGFTDEEEARRELIHDELDMFYMDYEELAIEFLEMYCLKHKIFHFKLNENGLFEPINQPQKGCW